MKAAGSEGEDTFNKGGLCAGISTPPPSLLDNTDILQILFSSSLTSATGNI